MTDEEDNRVRTSSSKRTKGSSDNIRSTYRSDEYGAGEGPKQNSVVTIFSIWNTMVGTSLLAMPWGMERAGLLAGFLIAIIMGGICLYTAYCNIDVQKQHGSSGGEVFQLCNQLLGPWAQRIAKLFSYIVLLGAVIIYWILMSNFFNFTVNFIYSVIFIKDDLEIPGFFDETVLCPSGFNKIVTNSSSLASIESVFNKSLLNLSPQGSGSNNEMDKFNQYWNLKTVPIYLSLVVGPLLCFRSPTFFTKFNSLGTLSVMYLMLFIFVKSVNWGFVNVTFNDSTSIHDTDLFNSSFGAMCGMLALSYFIHNIIISIVRNNRQPKNNSRDLSIAYVLVIVTYTFIGALFYISFPIQKSCIEDNLLNNFKVTDPLTVIARIFLFFQLVTVYPLIAFMLRSQVLSELTGTSSPSFKLVTVFNVLLVVTCILFAIFIPHIGTVIRFTGAISGFIHVFSLPCLLRIASLKKTGSLTITKLLINLIIPILGAINILLQFVTKDK